jgi:F0F1-type ATP synthase assembly protein I
MLDKKIRELQNKIDKISTKEINSANNTNSSLAILNVASEIVAGIIVGVIVGLLFDSIFSTKPWFLVICIFFAMVSAFRSIWKKYIK